jgi:hypothetical protein
MAPRPDQASGAPETKREPCVRKLPLPLRPSSVKEHQHRPGQDKRYTAAEDDENGSYESITIEWSVRIPDKSIKGDQAADYQKHSRAPERKLTSSGNLDADRNKNQPKCQLGDR